VGIGQLLTENILARENFLGNETRGLDPLIVLEAIYN